MGEMDISIKAQDVAIQWFQIAKGVAQGQLTPEEGVGGLRTLADAFPQDSDWLYEEIETIRHQFGLDVIERIQADEGVYWEKIRWVVTALLDERLDHARTLTLLSLINTQHPEHDEKTARLMQGLQDSPLRHYLDPKD